MESGASPVIEGTRFMASYQFVAEWLRGLKRNPAQILRKSRRWHCPLCDFQGWFIDMAGRRDARCPNCASRERDRIIWLYWRREPWDFANKRTLHFSPEKSIWPMLRHHPGYVSSGVEPHKRAARVLDIRALDCAEGAFDYLICNHVLEHVDHDAVAMRECFRVLKPGGKALFSVPLDPDRAETWNPPKGTPKEEIERICGRLHVRLYGCDFPDLLRAAGFEVEVIEILAEDDARHRLLSPRVDKVFVAIRPAA